MIGIPIAANAENEYSKKLLLIFNDPDFQKFWNQLENELIFYPKNSENNNKTFLRIDTFEFNPFLPFVYQIQNIEKNEINSRNLIDSKERDESEINFHIRTYDYKLNNENFTNENYYFDKGNVLYRINFTVPTNEFKQFSPKVTKILDGIIFNNTSGTRYNDISFGSLISSPIVNEKENMVYLVEPRKKTIHIINETLHSNKIHVSSHPNKLQFAPYQNEIFVSYYGSSVIDVYDGLDLDESRFFSLQPFSILDINLDPNEFNGWKNLLFVTLKDDFNNKTGNVRVIDTDAFEKNLPRIVYESQIYDNNSSIGEFNNSDFTISSRPNATLSNDAINYKTYADKTILDTNLNRIYILENLGDQTKVSIFNYRTEDNKFVTEFQNSANFSAVITDLVPLNRDNSIILTSFSSNEILKVDEDLNINSTEYYDTIPFPYKIIVNPENNSKIYVTSALQDNMTIIKFKDQDVQVEKIEHLPTYGALLGNYAISDKEDIIHFIDNNPKNSSLISFDYKNDTFVKKIKFSSNVKDINLKINCANDSYSNDYELDKYHQIPIDSKCKISEEIPSNYILSHWNSSLNSVYVSNNIKKPILDILTSSIKENNDNDYILQTAYPRTYTVNLQKVLGIEQQFQHMIKVHAQSISVGGLVTVLAGGVLAALYYRVVIFSKEQKHARWVMDKSDILTINSTIIIGVLIFLTISSGFEGREHDLTMITTLIVVPFAISGILAVFERLGMGTLLMVAGLMNLVLSVLVIAITQFNL